MLHLLFISLTSDIKCSIIIMIYVKRTTFLTVSVSLVLMRLEKTFAHPTIDDDNFELKGPKYPLDLMPIIDDIQIERAFTMRNYMKFLMKCVFFEGHCDFVGKWLKRMRIIYYT